MKYICFYLHVHQPRRVKKYSVFDVGEDHNYFNSQADSDLNNKKIIEKVANKSYLPTNKVLLELLEEYPGFKVSFSISGILIEQLKEFAPEVLDSFKELSSYDRVEFLAETYYHSLAFLASKEEFKEQVEKHKEVLNDVFDFEPDVFRYTELVYNNDIADFVEEMGFDGILAEGAEKVLGWRSPNFIYKPQNNKDIKVLLKNYTLSDDIAFRFSEENWEEHPLTASKFKEWISAIEDDAQLINLFMDYETFGEHQWAESGIFEFLRHFPAELLENSDNEFITPSEAINKYDSVGEIDVEDYVSWADTERDLSAWLGNQMQDDAFAKLYEIEDEVKESGDENLIEDWRKLQVSDHFYYMSTKWFADGDVHKYFNPYDSPYEAFISYMNCLKDLQLRVNSS